MNQKNILLTSLTFLYATLTPIQANDIHPNDEILPIYSQHIVHFADEYDNNHTISNRLITIDYKAMKILDTHDVEGSLNHHADPLGSLERANYLMMVPKGSNFVTIRNLSNGMFEKIIQLPFKPRSGDAYNKTHNLVLLTSRNRPAAVLIDTKEAKIVGKAGFNIKCGIRDIKNIYASSDNYDFDFTCHASDFGGDQISGHPLWLDDTHFVIIDRSNRLVHVYKIEPVFSFDDTYQWETKLVQTLKTDSSMHQIIPEDSMDENNTIFYGMTEGGVFEDSIGHKIIPRVYKYKFDGTKLTELLSTQIRFDTINEENFDDCLSNTHNPIICEEENIKTTYGILGHNLYITPDKQYLYAPLGGRLEQTTWSTKHIRKGAIFVISTSNLSIYTEIEAGKGAGHVAFSKQKEIAIVTNHMDNFVTAIDYKKHTLLKNIPLDFKNEGIFTLNQSHMQHISEDGEYYYNFWTDGGIFFRVNLSNLSVDSSIYTGGIPIQGNFYKKIVALPIGTPPLPLDDGFNTIFNDYDTEITNNSSFTPINSNENAANSNGYNK